ncbi:MAG TPA: cellulase family glycosylhydrolase [Candidatus Binatia bacterium]|nr:cellulase family glycosylhydrolase [Candidatus Binatia bacterium]
MKLPKSLGTPFGITALHLICLVVFVVGIFGSARRASAEGFLRTRGQDIVDEKGEKVLLRGVGLGNWMLPEGYMWRFGNEGDRPRKIERLVSDLIGEEKAAQFWKKFRKEYISEADIKRIAELGFNSVRPALNARLFLTEGEKPEYVQEGFELLDSLVGWCRTAGIYVIIDMHAAPGGQTGANIDDSARDQAELFADKQNQDRLADLWVKLATRYKDEPAIAAYDLLNEPLPKRTGAFDKYKEQLEPLYQRITKAIRAVDKRHIITIEGADWANDWSVFSQRFDDNLVYQFHYYCWDQPTNLKSVGQYLANRRRLDAPIWCGETGEKDNAIYWGTADYFEANNIGWSFWPWKKMETRNTPCSIKTPTVWEQIAAYSRGGGAKPSPEAAQKAFDELLKNIRLENCVFFPDVVNALFRRVPGRVEAENYGHEGPGKSYFVKNNSQNSKYYRTSEPVPVETLETGGGGRRSDQALKLGAEEWTAYTVGSLETRSYNAVVRLNAESAPAALQVCLGDECQETTITETGWVELKLKPVAFAKGGNRLKLLVEKGILRVDWVRFE